MTCGPQGILTSLFVEPGGSPHVFDTSSERWGFDVCTLGKDGKQIVQRDNTGSRSMIAEQVRQGPYLCFGNLRMRMTPNMLDFWLPRILGAVEATNVFNVSDSLPSFGVLKVITSTDGQIYTEEIKNCVVSRAIFRGKATQVDEEEPEPIEVTLQIAGGEHVLGTTPPVVALPIGIINYPYIFEQAVFTINSLARVVYDYQLVIDNHVQVRYANQFYPIDLCPTNRTVMLQTTLKADTANITGLFLYPDAGYNNATLTFTSTTLSAQFLFGCLEAVDKSPEINGQTEIPLQLTMRALKQGAVPEIVVTNDSTP
jgi:hypothetical protein